MDASRNHPSIASRYRAIAAVALGVAAVCAPAAGATSGGKGSNGWEYAVLTSAPADGKATWQTPGKSVEAKSLAELYAKLDLAKPDLGESQRGVNASGMLTALSKAGWELVTHAMAADRKGAILERWTLRRRAEPTAAAPKRELDIRVAPKGWGDAGAVDIRAVLRSAAGEIWRHLPNQKLHPIEVSHSREGPMVLLRRGPRGEYIVWLDVKGTYWCQFAYQFAHEFTHILCGVDEDKAHVWFEESICEMASIFAMRRMAETWKTSPPYPGWRSYSASLAKYVEKHTARAELLDDPAFVEWYGRHAAELEKNAWVRDRNRVVARKLLALFEKTPEHWEAVVYLRGLAPERRGTFKEHLAKWRRRAPGKHRAFIAKIAALFGLGIE